ncbi:MAG: hypothetical protein K6C97_06210 [Treponema sp.]|nr:hypothetical protein [Treponema sp.]
MIETVLCVDIGTTSLKAGLIAADGEVVSFSSSKFGISEDRFIAGKWILSLKAALSEILSKTDLEKVQIKAVTISGNGPTIVSQSEITIRWNEDLDLRQFGITKEDIGPSLFLPKILLFKELFRKDFDQTKYIFSGPEYLIFRLTGHAVTILPEERFKPAYWDDQLLQCFDIPCEKMPPFVGIGQVCGSLTKDMADFLKLEKGLPVISGGPDFVVALIGTKTLKAGRICDRCGSSEGFNYCIPKFLQAPGVRSLPSVIPGLWNASVLLANSSSLSEQERLDFAKNALLTLKALAQKNDIEFPKYMIVTGGQAKDSKLMKDKARYLGMRLYGCQCADAELLGDACAGFLGLGLYENLAQAAENLVRAEKLYDDL